MTTRTIGVATALALLACGGGVDTTPRLVIDSAAITPPEPAAEDHACPEGVVAFPYWAGEWPSPVVQVTAPTAVKGYAAPCATTADVDCAVPIGLYNPWAEGDTQYTALSSVVAYVTTAPITVGGKEVPAGTEVVMVHYLAEGYCELNVAGEEVEDTCPELVGLAPDGPYKQVGTPAEFPERQLFLVACEGGGEAWVAPEDVLAEATAQEGEYVEYGKVGPKGSGGF